MLPFLSLKFFILAVIVSVLAAFAQLLLPSKRLVIAPNADNRLVLFYDGRNGGGSQAYWDEGRASKAICEIQQSDVSQYCGFLTNLGDGNELGLDVSMYDSVKVNFTYSGDASRVRIFMRHHDPLFSTVGNAQTAKFISASVPVEEFAKPLLLKLDSFSVAEWWLSAYSVPRELSQPDFSNVIKLGFDLTSPIPLGRHELQLDRLEFVGQWISKRQWYLGMFLFWIGFIAVWMIQHSLRIRRRLAKDDTRLAALTAAGKEPAGDNDQDQVTGAMSRSGMSRVLHQLYDAGGAELKPCAMVLLDVDGFGKLKKRYGHDCANKILQAIGQTVMGNSRATDLVCHWSDDRFLVIAPGARVIDMAVFAEKIRGLVAKEVFPSDKGDFSVTISAGVAEAKPKSSFEQTFALANHALLQAKASGKNAVHCAGL